MEQTSTSTPCHNAPTISSEQFIPEHIFIYMVSGTMTIYDGNHEYHMKSGDYGFAKRNHLVKYIKKPPAGGEFKAVGIFLNQDFLKSFSREYGYTGKGMASNEAAVKLNPNPLFHIYIQSVLPYQDLTGTERDNFLFLKNRELVLILLKTNPELKDVLFDFSDPGKIDLESFMNKNFRFNVSMKRFGYLTGRSLTTFKRDFEKIFNTSPGRWLLQKRLEEAYYLISKKGRKPSDVYLEVGFEDLSHFSYSFKKAFGRAPSQLV